MVVLALDLPDLSTFTNLGAPFNYVVMVLVLAWAAVSFFRQLAESRKVLLESQNAKCDARLKELDIAARESEVALRNNQNVERGTFGDNPTDDTTRPTFDLEARCKQLDERIPALPSRKMLIVYFGGFIIFCSYFFLPLSLSTQLCSAVTLVGIMLCFASEILIRHMTRTAILDAFQHTAMFCSLSELVGGFGKMQVEVLNVVVQKLVGAPQCDEPPQQEPFKSDRLTHDTQGGG